MNYYFSFDVESVGLFGEPFAVGWVVVDQEGTELDSGYAGMTPPLTDPDTEVWLAANVYPALPEPQYTEGYRQNFSGLCADFWEAWEQAKVDYPGIIMVCDCPFPVETNFLTQLVRERRLSMVDSPYPLIDVASVLLARGLDPLKPYTRLPNELPVHNPVNDARQSARMLVEALKNVVHVEDLSNLDVPGLR